MTQGSAEQKVYLFDWGRYKLASGVTIVDSVFTFTKIRPAGGVGLVSDHENVLSGERKTWLRLGGATTGDYYQVTNTVTTNEDPSQTFSLSFRLLIENR